ncbi:MAG TPA: amino acid adenylation domain-containing protein, partial [Puia sp.]|nr:amino acid adenylation domain-containing protein [Puia sp.]
MDRKVIHSVFEAVADRIPSKTAIETENAEITYGELNRFANRLSHLFQSIGYGKEKIVNVVMPSSIRLVGTMLAAFKSGLIFLPVDLAFSEKRWRQLFMETSDGLVVVTEEMADEVGRMMDKLGIEVRHMVTVDDQYDIKVYDFVAGKLQTTPFCCPDDWDLNPVLEIDGGDSNYIFYTSGSTGEGKAIVGANASLSHFIHWEIKEFKIEETCRVSQLTQVTFDASLRDIFVALISGGVLCIPSADTKNNPAKLLRWLEQYRITIVHCVPSLFRILTKELAIDKKAAYDLSHLKHILMAGESLYAKDILSWRTAAGETTELVNLYGATETTLIKTFYRIGSVPNNPAYAIPVGVPISNTSIAIIKDGEICKVGETGEIYIKTPFATKGYYKNEQLTRECFVQNPLQQEPKDIVYRTGDIGRYLPDRNIELLGRSDSQVKVNGIRVELLEVEQALRGIADITGVVVKAQRTDDGIVNLVAYYTGEKMDTGILRQQLLVILNQQAIPSYFIHLKEFPLNINGKIDKKALPLPEEMMMGGADFKEPVGEWQIKIAGLWREILGHEKIGSNISFFTIGGNSLRAILLISRLNKEFGIGVRIGDIFTHDTIAGQEKLIADSLKKEYQEISLVPAAPHYPLSSSQHRLWVLSQFEEVNIAYNMPGVYLFEGNPGRAALEYAFKSLIERHEILRTVFKYDEQGNIRQFINSMAEMDFRITYRDVRGQKEETIKKILQEEFIRPFNLATGPLLRAGLYQAAEDRWIFTYVMHHIISDGWSMAILIRELLQLYNAAEKGDKDPLPPLRIQYKDYASWQRMKLSGEDLQQHKNYWLRQFEGELPLLDLPGGKPRPPVKTHKGDSISKKIDGSIARGIRTIIHDQGATLFMGLLAAVNALLYRVTGQNDFIIGTPVAGRDHMDLEDQIGFYVNTLALRIQLKGEDSYQELLEKVKQVTLGAYQHQAYPFDELVDDLHLHRDISRNPLFDAQVIVQEFKNNHKGEDQRLGNLEVSKYEGAKRMTSVFDLVFNFAGMDDELFLNLTYNSDIYDADMVARLLQQVERFLQAIIASPRLPVNRLSFLHEGEKARLLREFNDTAVTYPGPRTLVELFEEQVVKSPDKVAVVFSGEELSYRELNEQSDRLAGYLRSNHGVEAEELVGIMLDRSDKMIIAILGVLKAGGAYVPIDPDYPAARKDYILRDGGIRVLITHTEYIFNLDYYQGAVFAMDVQMDDLASPAPMVRGSGAEALAYVIYTSGSTGQPKGVMIDNGAIVNTIRSQREIFAAEAGERHLQFASCSFDASVSEIFVALSAGSALYIIGEEAKKEPRLLEEYLREHKIEMATIPPAYLKLLSIERLESLKKLITAGEAALRDKAKAFLRQGTYYNAYGPTETSICASVFKVEKGRELEVTSVPIGVPVANTRVYILDGQTSLQPIGVTGELWISGAGLARGYLNQPGLTEERFVASPFTKGERMYKTGDLGRWLAGGDIEFGGRKDDQVKIRGYRIELGEIEGVLQSYPGIDAAAVIVGRDSGEEKELIAYIAGKETVNLTDLRGHLNKTLPDYMLPGRYIQMESLPLTVNGKIDRKKLPSLEGSDMSANVPYVAPRNETETKLVSIWQGILEKEKISIKDNFFDLGGHSLKATRLASRIQKDFEVEISLKELFETALLEEQARLIEQARKLPFFHISPARGQSHYPLSSSQHRLWVLSQFEEGNIAYNMPGAYVFEGNLDPRSLEYAFQSLIRRHESLRTVFREDQEGKIGQFIHPGEKFPFEIAYQDLRQEAGQEKKIKDLVQQQFSKAFDLAAGPLVKAALFQVEDNKWVLTYMTHHIISDVWSLDILIKELLLFYKAHSEEGVLSLPPLRIHYKDYAVWQQAQVTGETLNAHKAYWLEKFKGEIPVLELPGDKPRPSIKTYNGRSANKALRPELYHKIKTLAQQEESTLFMALLAAVNALLYRYTGQKDIVLGSPVAGREHSDLDDQIGFFVNTLALRMEFREEDSYRDLLHNARRLTLEAYEHQAYPFDELVNELHIQRNMSRSALFDVIVSLRNMGMKGIEEQDLVEGLKISQYREVEIPTSRFDLSLNFVEMEEGLLLTFEYNSDIFESSTIEGLGHHWEQLMEAMLAARDQPVIKLDFLTGSEKRQLLEEFGGALSGHLKGRTIVGSFEEQVDKGPDRIALMFEEKTLTYKELNDRSDQAADYLKRTFAIQNGDLIGIMLDRSEKMIIAILGVLKSGGAYVPIDPDYPKERKEHIVKDTGIRALITQTDYIFDLEFYEGGVFAIDVQLDSAMSPSTPDALSTPDTLSAPDTPPGLKGPGMDPGSLAYVMYTSGSTGKPKGVMVEQAGILRLVKSTDYITFTEEDVLLSTGSVSFDATTFEYWGMLLNGGCLVMCRHEVLLDARRLAEEMEKRKISLMWFTSGWLNQLVDTDIEIFRGLKTVVAGGDKLSPVHINSLRRLYPALNIVNGYGPTENTTFSLTYRITSSLDSIPVGKPIHGSTAYILGDQLSLLPIGAIGEICLGGNGLARGYLNQPDLTAEKFVTNPFREGRVYKTGDLGRWLPDGNIAFIGRKDDQVKIRGYRVELGEIEKVLQDFQPIDSAVVIARRGDQWTKELIAYFVARETMDPSGIRSYLNGRLPSYMVPAHFIQLEKFPLTANGKVDKKNLPEPEELNLVSGAEYAAPRNEKEEAIVHIWQQLLGRDRIGIKDNFFEIGGDSIKILSMVSEVRKKIHLDISIAEIYKNGTIENILAHAMSSRDILNSRRQSEELRATVIAEMENLKKKILSSGRLPDRDNIEDIYPMSDIEKGMIYESLVNEGAGIYHDQLANKRTFFDFQINTFREALELLVEKHAILRTSFSLNDFDTEVQLVHKKIDLPVQYKDISDWTSSRQESEIRDFITSEYGNPFDISKAPLWRINVFRISRDEIVFVLQFHHAIMDGWSHALFITELNNLYLKLEETPSYKPETLQSDYKDFIIQHEIDKKDDAVKGFWKEDLQHNERLDLFTDENELKKYSQSLDDDGVKKIHQAALELNTTVKALSLSAYLYMLKVLNYDNEVLAGVVTNTRPVCPDSEKVLGCFLNTIPFRLLIDPEKTCYDLVVQVYARLAALKDYERLSLLEIAQIHGVQSDPGNPFFDTFFNYVDFHAYDSAKEDTKKDRVEAPSSGIEVSSNSRTNILLDFTVDLTGGGYRVGFTLSKKLRSGLTPERLGALYFNILSYMTHSPHQALRLAGILDPDEKYRLLVEFNDTPADYSRDRSVMALFEEQVSLAPGNIALVSGNTAITYGELNERSNKLGDYLRKNYQVAKDDLIGIKLERSEWLLIAIFGVLKSGAAYLPIDPDYPPDRIGYMIADSKCKLLIDKEELERFKKEEVIYAGNNPEPVKEDPGLAYVIYTSGSTGLPKGCAIEHNSLSNYIQWANGYYFREGPLPIFGLYTSLSFDLTITSLFCPLTKGGKLIIHPPETDIIDILTGVFKGESEINSIKLTPSHISILGDLSIRSSAITCAIVGGEQITRQQVRILKEINPSIKIYNEYGPTEATVGCIVTELQENAPILIGKPISGAEVYILDQEQALNPIGVIGELYIGGAGLARAYLGQPGLTREKFLPNPFIEGKRIYKTGDLCRWLPDGNIEFIGRRDEQVKIRGYRIELEEIEQTLRQHEQVESAAVSVLARKDGQRDLVAYLVSKATISIPDLRASLSKSLPAYMLPGYYVQLDKLPLSANGKLNRKALPSPEGLDISTGVEYIPPRNELERQLVEIWQELLGRDRIGIEDNFFEVGGHSLKATRLVNQIHKILKVKLPLKQLFNNPVLADQARLIRQAQKASYTEIPPVAIRDGYPLSSSQRRLWTLSQDPRENITYNIPGVYLLEGELDRASLEYAFDRLMDRHEILRTVFEEDQQGEVQQVVYPQTVMKLDIPYLDLRQEQQPAEKLKELINKELQTPFHLSQ